MGILLGAQTEDFFFIKIFHVKSSRKYFEKIALIFLENSPENPKKGLVKILKKITLYPWKTQSWVFLHIFLKYNFESQKKGL